MANDYTTSAAAFAEMSEGNYSAPDYPQMASFVTTASRLIDAETGRWEGFFYPTTDTKTFYYDGSGYATQEIDEFASISEVAVSEQGGTASTDYTAWTVDTDYFVAPYNYSNKAKPINQLVLKDYNGTKGAWYRYQRSVRVQGIAGYSTTPPDAVVQACKIQSCRWFMRAKQGYADTGVTAEIGGLTFSKKLELDPDVKQLLWSLKLELDR